MIMDYTADNDTSGTRLDVFLSATLADISRSRIQKIIANGNVSINGKKIIKKNAILNAGDTVSVDDDVSIHPTAPAPQPQDIPLDVLYEDEHLAVINKPAGLVVHPGNGNADGTVVNALLHRFGASVSSGSEAFRPGIVHRLDKDTTGALAVAKSDAAHAALAALFQSREIEKTYTGFCVGARPADHEVIDLPLAPSRRDPIRRAVDARRGKPAVTEYRLENFDQGISLVNFTLHTGRTHQIRVHCSHKGFPIVGDTLYGGGKERVLKIPPMERPFAYSVFKCFARQALHALSLSFIHPFTKENVKVVAPYPGDFCGAMGLLLKSNS